MGGVSARKVRLDAGDLPSPRLTSGCADRTGSREVFQRFCRLRITGGDDKQEGVVRIVAVREMPSKCSKCDLYSRLICSKC